MVFEHEIGWAPTELEERIQTAVERLPDLVARTMTMSREDACDLLSAGYRPGAGVTTMNSGDIPYLARRNADDTVDMLTLDIGVFAPGLNHSTAKNPDDAATIIEVYSMLNSNAVDRTSYMGCLGVLSVAGTLALGAGAYLLAKAVGAETDEISTAVGVGVGIPLLALAGAAVWKRQISERYINIQRMKLAARNRRAIDSALGRESPKQSMFEKISNYFR